MIFRFSLSTDVIGNFFRFKMHSRCIGYKLHVTQGRDGERGKEVVMALGPVNHMCTCMVQLIKLDDRLLVHGFM